MNCVLISVEQAYWARGSAELELDSEPEMGSRSNQDRDLAVKLRQEAIPYLGLEATFLSLLAGVDDMSLMLDCSCFQYT